MGAIICNFRPPLWVNFPTMNQFTSPRALGILLLVNAALFARTPIYTALKAESMASGAGVGLAVIFAMVLVLLNFGLGIYLLAKKR